jgi:CheY-like chemotaxis protein
MVLAVNPPQVSTTHTTTVLFIDDNDEDLKYWCELLKRFSSHHYTVLDAPSAESGLELCRSNRIDCVVLELDMPESGFCVLFDLIRDRTPRKIPGKLSVSLCRMRSLKRFFQALKRALQVDNLMGRGPQPENSLIRLKQCLPRYFPPPS